MTTDKYADEIESVQRCFYPLGPPGEVVFAVGGPPVMGMPPKLSVRSKRIGWAASEHLGSTGTVQSEQFGVGLHIGAVGSTKDRKVANQLDVEAACVLSQRLPLTIQDPLHKGVVFTLGGVF